MADRQALNAKQSIAIIRAMAKAITEQQDFLSSLDSTVGDGDHGHNLAKALTEATKQLQNLNNPTLNAVWRTAGKSVQDSVGGASGLLFGAFFMGAARTVKEKEAATVADVVEMLNGGLTQIQKRGKAQPGDKTMIDALAPAVEAAQSALSKGHSLPETVHQATAAAQAGAEATQQMIAKQGRAKFLGERSKGYQDAGATSMAMMLAAWADWLNGE